MQKVLYLLYCTVLYCTVLYCVQGEAAEAEGCSAPVPCVLVPDLPILGNMTPALELQTNVI